MPKLEQLWRYSSTELNDFEPVICEEGVILTTLSGKIILLDVNDGKTIWTNELGGEIITKPFIIDGKISVASKIDEKSFYTREISIKTGITIKTNLATSLTDFGNQNGIASDNSAEKIIVDKNTLSKTKNKSQIWKNKFGGQINQISYHKNNILVSSSDNYLYLINSKSGNRMWKLRLTGKVLGSEVLFDNIGIANVFGSGQIQIVNFANGKLISNIALESTEYAVVKPIVADKKVIIQTNLGIICFTTK